MTFEDIRKELEQDGRNRVYTEKGIPPIFQADKEAEILIIGQAPGRKAERTRIPFNDASGEKLRFWLGMDQKTFYSKKVAIVPMDFYYPGKGKTGDLPPRKFIAEEYHGKILSLMKNIRLTVLIGRYAQEYYLTDRAKKTLTETVGSFREYLPEYFPLVHPSPLNRRWLKMNPWFEKETVQELQRLVKEIL